MVNRRKFLSNSILGFTGYSVIVNMPKLNAVTAEEKNIPKKLLNLGKNKTNGFLDEKNMNLIDLSCDVLVAGGGLAGICAAISSARHGKKVVLFQDRSRLGGNSSSEIKMHPLGVYSEKVGFREGGIIEELKLENATKNPQYAWEYWDFILYDKVISEPNITLLLDTSLFKVEMDDENKIKKAFARCETSRTIYSVNAKIFIDATGDARLAMESGDNLMTGREGSKKYGETLADFDAVGSRMGSSILFTAKKYKNPMPWTPPSWAKKVSSDMLKFKKIRKDNFSYGYWWIELGGDEDAISNTEKLRFELLSVVMGVWDYIKNSGEFPDAKYWALNTVGMIPGRRDTFRIEPEFLFTQQGVEGEWKNYKDSVCVGGWPLDDHPKEGFNNNKRKPANQVHSMSYYNIPFGSLYSKKIKNLMMCGRNAGMSHVAMSSTRVMTTCATMGQAVGTAASLSIDENKNPSQIRNNPKTMKILQQMLLRDDQSIIGLTNEDENDIARLAKITASDSSKGTHPDNILSGVCFEFALPETSNKKIYARDIKNRWICQMNDKPVWIQLEWDTPQKIKNIQISFDSGNKLLAMVADNRLKTEFQTIPQKELIKDFRIIGILENGSQNILAEEKDNYQKLYKRSISDDGILIKSLKIEVLSTNGSPNASIFEVRCYS